jgi:hypothetical protein
VLFLLDVMRVRAHIYITRYTLQVSNIICNVLQRERERADSPHVCQKRTSRAVALRFSI